MSNARGEFRAKHSQIRWLTRVTSGNQDRGVTLLRLCEKWQSEESSVDAASYCAARTLSERVLDPVDMLAYLQQDDVRTLCAESMLAKDVVALRREAYREYRDGRLPV